MSRYWLRHPQRDQLLGPDTLDNLLGQLPVGDPEEWAGWQAMEAKGQSFSALKSDIGWQPLAKLAAESSRQAWLDRATASSQNDAPDLPVPAELNHMRPGIGTALENLPEPLAAAHNDRWPLVLRQVIRHGTAYSALRTVAGILAIVGWCAIGLTALWQITTAIDASPNYGGNASAMIILWPIGCAIIAALVVFVLLHLVWLLCDLADQGLERLRQSNTAPGQPPSPPAV